MERRTTEGYKLRIYIDAIKAVKSMSDAEWIETQAACGSSGLYMTRLQWLAYLEGCAIQEAERLLPIAEASMTREETLKELRGLVDLSKLPHDATWELANQYWPDAYAETIINSPWLLVRTPAGMVRIGWRKRVLHIDWADTKIGKIITEDETTKNPTTVHAHSISKAVEYLTKLAEIIKVEA
jgi:hypothetical protein